MVDTDTSRAVQLCHRNWREIIPFLGARIAEANMVRLVDTNADPCGEPGPYIELTILTPGGALVARHGDLIVRTGEDVSIMPPAPGGRGSS